MSVRSYLVLLKTSGMLKGKNPCQILNLSQKNIALIKTTLATKIMWIVRSCMPWNYYRSHV